MHLLRVFHDGSERVVEVAVRTVIGRDPTCSICLPDPMVAREHAKIEQTSDDRFLLRDLGSRHGTYVSGRRVSEAYLSHGDEILIGVFRLRFEDAAGSLVASAGRLLDDDLLPRKRVPISDPHFPPASAYGDDEETLKRNYERLRAAFELSRSVGIEADVNLLLDRILETAFQLLGTDRGAVLLLGDGQELSRQVARTRSGEKTPLILSETIINEVVATKSAVLTGDTAEDSRFRRARSLSAQGIRSAMAVPLLYGQELLGLMHLDSQIAHNVFSETDLDLFMTVAGQAAMAVKNAILMQRLRKAMVWERLDRVVQSLPEGLLLLDGEKRITLVNEPMSQLLPLLSERGKGELIEELANIPVGEIVSWECRTMRELVIEGPPRRILDLTGTRIGGDGSADAEYLIVLRDVTEEREREHRARQQDQLALLGQLASGVAHDFNNLLTVILNYAELMEPRIHDPSMRDDFDQIRQAALRATALTRQLLAFSRRESLKAQVVELNGVLAGMERLLELSVGKRVLLRSHKAAQPLRIDADPTKVEQVIINLVVNARDAMPGGGTLTLETEALDLDANTAHREHGLPGGRYVRLRVSDTGSGMPPEVRERIFEPFFTTKEVGQGTGLGLAMVYGIVTQAGGVISVRSEPGKGTTFDILFKASRGEQQDEIEATGADGGTAFTGSASVLVVDDDDSVRRSVSRILRQRGLSVFEASSGESALKLLDGDRLKIDFLITDVVMPGMSGIELTSALRARGRRFPVLYISGEIDGAIARASLRDGGTLFLAKPFSREDLLQSAQATLEGVGAAGFEEDAPLEDEDQGG